MHEHDSLFTFPPPDVIAKVIKILRELIARGPDLIGQSLVPYYKYVLPVLNLFCCQFTNLDGQTDYGQRHEDGRQIANLCADITALFEIHGGPDAFFNIKYMIPTYESCVYS